MSHTDITNWLLPDDLAAQAEDMYYSTDPVIPVKEIYAKLGLEYRAKPYLFQRFPPEDTGETCRHCGGPIKKFFLSKSTATMGNDSVIHKEPGHTYCYEKRCIQCGHHPEGPCHCQNCQDEQLRTQQQQEQERRDTLYCTFPYPDEASMVSFHDLSVEDRIRLSIAVLYGSDENVSQIFPPETRFRSGTISQIIKQVMIPLFRKRILYISPMSDLNGFDWDSLDQDSNLRHFYAGRVAYLPNVREFWEPDQQEIFFNLFQYTPDECGEVLAFWNDYVYQEALIFFRREISHIYADFSPGKKSEELLKRMLRTWPLSHVFRAIYYECTQVLADIERNRFNGYGRRHWANIAVRSIDGYFDWANTHDWEIYPYVDKDYPLSEIADYLSTRVLPLGTDVWLKTVPDIRIVEQFSNRAAT